MKNKKLNFLKLGIIIFGIYGILWNCIDENNIDLDQNDVLEQVMDFQSIETDEAKSLINTIITKNKKHSKKGGFSITIDEKSLNFTEVKKTNLNIPTFSASIKPDIHSTVFMVKKHGVIYPCLYNYIPTKNNSSEGTIIVSTIDGEFINGYKVVDGVFVCQYKQKTNSETASKPAADPDYIWDLGELYPIEIHTSLGAGGISFDNGYDPVTNQGWMSLNLAGGRSTRGGGSSNGKSGNTKNTKPPLFPCDRPTPRGCECAKDEFKDASGKCVKKPCVGDPVAKVEIAPQLGPSGIQGALHNTCARYDKDFTCRGVRGRRKHDGVDLKNPYGAPIFASYDGIAKKATQLKEGKLDGAGHYVGVTSRVNGKKIRLVYFHLQKNRRTTGTIKAGDIIGYQGVSGNLKSAIEDKNTTSHVHVKAQENDKSAEPLDHFKTKINPKTGEVINPCN